MRLPPPSAWPTMHAVYSYCICIQYMVERLPWLQRSGVFVSTRSGGKSCGCSVPEASEVFETQLPRCHG